MIRLLVAAVLAGGCYSPSDITCSITCSEGERCPGGLVCAGDGFCHDSVDEPACGHALEIEVTGPGQIVGDAPCVDSCNLRQAGTLKLATHPNDAGVLETWTLDEVPLDRCDTLDCPIDIEMSADHRLTATFTAGAQVDVVISGGGHGVVKSVGPGVRCNTDAPGRCQGRFPIDATVVLEPQPAFPSVFGVWSGACAAATPGQKCSFVADSDKTVGVVSSVTTVQLIVAPELGSIGITVPLEDGTTTTQTCNHSNPSACIALFPPGDSIPRTISAILDDPLKYELVTWVNACQVSPQQESCSQPFPQDVMVLALFGAKPILSIDNLRGGGTVAVTDLISGAVLMDVPASTTKSLGVGTNTQLVVAASPEDAFRFQTWGGDTCPVGGANKNPCTFALGANRVFQPTFGADLTITVNGTGKITIDDPLFPACSGPATCGPFALPANQAVTLTPSPLTINGAWTSCPGQVDSNSKKCSYIVTGDASATYTF